MSKLIGELFIVKSSVNLESDMLSLPDFFWYKSTYLLVQKYKY